MEICVTHCVMLCKYLLHRNFNKELWKGYICKLDLEKVIPNCIHRQASNPNARLKLQPLISYDINRQESWPCFDVDGRV